VLSESLGDLGLFKQSRHEALPHRVVRIWEHAEMRVSARCHRDGQSVLKRFPKIFLVSTSLAPILITLAFLEIRAHDYWTAVAWLVGALVLVMATRGLLYLCRQQLEPLNVHFAKAKTSDREVIGFLLAYVTPLALTSGKVPEIDAWAIAFLILLFGAVVWGTHAYDFNPLLGLMGYHFFEVENDKGITYIVITRKSIVDVHQITAVVQLTEYVLLDRT
jgi:hypothetical protein